MQAPLENEVSQFRIGQILRVEKVQLSPKFIGY